MTKVICRFTGPAENKEGIEKQDEEANVTTVNTKYHKYVSRILSGVLKLFKGAQV